MDPRKLIRKLPDLAGPLRDRPDGGTAHDRRLALLDAVLLGATALADIESIGLVQRSDSLSATLALGPLGETALGWPMRLPAPATLLPPGPFAVQIVVHSQPPSVTPDPLSASYLQLTRHNCARNRWAYLSLTSTVSDQAALLTELETLRGRLAAEGIAARPLDTGELLSVVSMVSHLDSGFAAAGTALVRRSLGGFEIGQTAQACFSWTEPTGHSQVLSRLCLLPVDAATVGVTVSAAGGELRSERVLRLAAPDKGSLARAKLRVTAEIAPFGAQLEPLDGKHLPAAAVTFPVGAAPDRRAAGSWTRIAPAHAFAAEHPWGGGAGLLLGWDSQHGGPVPARLFQDRPTGSLVIGHGLAKLIALRAVGSGAGVTVQSARPHTWTGPFQLLPPGVPVAASGGQHRPHLVVADHQPADYPLGAYQAQLTVLDELLPHHLTQLAAADLVVFGDLDAPQRALANAAFGMAVSQLFLQPGQAVAVSKDQLSCFALCPTPFEQSTFA